MFRPSFKCQLCGEERQSEVNQDGTGYFVPCGCNPVLLEQQQRIETEMKRAKRPVVKRRK